MADQKPWFLVMTPEDANRPDSQWVRMGAFSRGKIVAMPIAREGWIALIAFIVLLVTSAIGIWSRFVFGELSLIAAIGLTVAALAVIVALFIALVRKRMTRLPPRAGA